MNGVVIKVSPNHRMTDPGESLGSDSKGENYSFWGSTPDMIVPVELAIKLELEKPQRFHIKDREEAKRILETVGLKVKEDPVKEPELTVDESLEIVTVLYLKKMTKDEINDWAAKKGFEANTRFTKSKMISSLVKQIEAKIGKKVQLR